jgi:signal transduction histidine kinase
MSIECQEYTLPVRFDSQGYHLILSNLVSNSVKYTSEGFVKVSLKRQDTWAVVEVTDSGIGIPEADIPSLFKEFFRASNAKRQKIQGTGVGLAGVKHIVERFGGELELQSRENEGTTFIVHLPLYSE